MIRRLLPEAGPRPGLRARFLLPALASLAVLLLGGSFGCGPLAPARRSVRLDYVITVPAECPNSAEKLLVLTLNSCTASTEGV